MSEIRVGDRVRWWPRANDSIAGKVLEVTDPTGLGYPVTTCRWVVTHSDSDAFYVGEIHTCIAAMLSHID